MADTVLPGLCAAYPKHKHCAPPYQIHQGRQTRHKGGDLFRLSWEASHFRAELLCRQVGMLAHTIAQGKEDVNASKCEPLFVPIPTNMRPEQFLFPLSSSCQHYPVQSISLDWVRHCRLFA